MEKHSTEGDDISFNKKNNRTNKNIADTSVFIQAFNNLVDCKSTADIFTKSSLKVIQLNHQMEIRREFLHHANVG